MNEHIAKIIYNVKITKDVYKLKFYSDLIDAKAGQFLMIDCVPERMRSMVINPFLRRPFSFYVENNYGYTIIYKNTGPGTKLLTMLKPHDEFWISAPLGKPVDLSICKGKNIHLISGGLGIAPMVFLAKKIMKNKTFKYPNFYIGLNEFNNLTPAILQDLQRMGTINSDISISYEDQNFDRVSAYWELPKNVIIGNAIQLFMKYAKIPIDNSIVFACGPEEMMKKLHFLCWSINIPCYVFIERHMGCGNGSCHACSVNSKYVCTDGPCFLSSDIFGQENEI